MKLLNDKFREMNEDELFIFITLELNKNVTEFYSEFLSASGGWVLSAIAKRFSAHGIKADKRVLIMTLSLGDGVVGKCAKYVDDMAKWAEENKCSSIDWAMFTRVIYPNGFPII